MNNFALTKFYGVMTAALSLKNNRLDYYQQLVLQAQIEIAETHYQMGQYADAAEFYSRLLKQTSEAGPAAVQFRLVHSLVATAHNEEAGGGAGFSRASRTSRRHRKCVIISRNHSRRWAGPATRCGRSWPFCRRKKTGQKSSRSLDLLAAARRQRNRQQTLQGRRLRQGAGNISEPGPAGCLGGLAVAGRIPGRHHLRTFVAAGKGRRNLRRDCAAETAVGTNATPDFEASRMARWRAGFIGWQSKAELADQSLSEVRWRPTRPPQIVTQ